MISKLKNIICKHNNSAILFNTKDPFLSEYSKEGFNLLFNYIGFSGSNGYLLMFEKRNVFFTDGRYLEQASRELAKDFEIIDLVDLDKFVLKDETNILFPNMCFSINEINLFQKHFGEKAIFVPKDVNFFDQNLKINFYSDVSCLSKKEAGKSSDEKISDLIKSLNLSNDEIYINSDSSAISWLFNIRSIDIAFNPVVCSYLIVSNDKIKLFVDCQDVDKVKNQVNAYEIEIFSKEKLLEIANQLAKFTKKIKTDAKITNYFFKDCFKDSEILYFNDPIILAKSIKNKTEIKNIIKAHEIDGIALTKFLYWFEHYKNKAELSELDVVEKLAKFRIESDKYMGPSFPTICGFADNGAIIHYRADEKSNKFFNKDSLLLIDSGGQYLFGTTDVTRTISVGKPTKEMIKNFTLVLKGNINLSKQKFPKRNSGAALDSIARQFLWNNHIDYAHGTGHGVGYYLNVHEGPQSISSRSFNEPIKSGMIVSNEPGYYQNGGYGIRIENLELVTDSKNNFLEFKPLTVAPISKKLIDKNLLSESEKDWFNNYHDQIIKKIGKELSQDEREWVLRQKI